MNDRDMVEFLHNSGLMNNLVYYQRNGKTAQENYIDQKRKQQQNYKKQRELEKLKKQMEDQIFEAVMYTMEQTEAFEEEVASDIVNMISSAFETGSMRPEKLENRSFSSDLGATLGRALAMAPFKLLEEVFDDIMND